MQIQRPLKKEFNFSNQSILNALSKKGFYVVEDSKSNYNFTHMSLGSQLNLDYLKNLDTDKTFHTKEFLQSNYTVYKNELSRILYKEGYRINNYSIFDIERSPTSTTPYLEELHYRSVFGQTFFKKVRRDIGYHLRELSKSPEQLNKHQKKIVANDITRLQETFEGVIATSKRIDKMPQFTYAHFMMPHTPYYFDSNGNRLSESYSFHTTDNKKDYANYVTYTNKFIIIPLIDSILHRKRPVIIVIQGDHGYRNFPPEQVLLEMENFCAVYFFDQNYNQLYHTMSSVNIFRVILNNYFNEQLPLLKDSVINLRKSYTAENLLNQD